MASLLIGIESNDRIVGVTVNKGSQGFSRSSRGDRIRKSQEMTGALYPETWLDELWNGGGLQCHMGRHR